MGARREGRSVQAGRPLFFDGHQLSSLYRAPRTMGHWFEVDQTEIGVKQPKGTILCEA
jgi:hypothetical protein